MKFKNLLFLFPLYVSLLSCQDKLNIPNSPSSYNVNSTEGAEQTTIHINTKYLHLLGIVERLRVYIEEEKAQWDPTKLEMKPESKENYTNTMNLYLASKTQDVEELYELTFKLLHNQFNIDDYLQCLLIKRIDYLTKRQHEIKAYLSPYTLRQETYVFPVVPTSKRLFKWVAQDHKFVKYKHINNRIRIHTIQKFELLNLLIKEAFQTCLLEELTASTIALLRGSVQLHPLLEGSSQDLGHPDAAGGDYAVLEALIFHPSEESYKDDFSSSLLNLVHDQLIGCCKELCKKTSYELTLKGLANYIIKIGANNSNLISKERTLNLAQLNASEKFLFNDITDFADNTSKRNTDRLKAGILKIRQNLDLEIFSAHPIENLHALIANLENNYGINLRNIRTASIQDRSEHGLYPLPCPNFLKIIKEQPTCTDTPLVSKETTETKKRRRKLTKKQRLQLLNTANNKNRIETPKASPSTSQADKVLSNLTAEVSNLNLTDSAPNLMQELSQASVSISRSPVLTDKPDLKVNLGMSLQEKDGNNEATQIFTYEKEKEKENEKEKEKEKEYEREIAIDSDLSLQEATFTGPSTRIWSFETNWILPRGLRAFHNNMLPSPYQEHKSLHHQGIVNQLFNSEQKCSVTFKEFKILWISEGGEIGNSGGSHKELIGPSLSTTIKGKTLFGIFAHGNKQTYGKEYIKYLQTAILYIGLRPDDFITE